jgi:hypothetical protein
MEDSLDGAAKQYPTGSLSDVDIRASSNSDIVSHVLCRKYLVPKYFSVCIADTYGYRKRHKTEMDYAFLGFFQIQRK